MSVFKLAARAVGLFNPHLIRINLATLYAVKHRLGPFRLVEVLVAEIIVCPQTEHRAYACQEVN